MSNQSASGGEVSAESEAAPGAPASVASDASDDEKSSSATPVGAAQSASEAAADALELLAKVHMFEGLRPAYLKRIAAIGAREQHESGAVIFSEGSVGDKMYLILSGAVRISREVPGMGEEALAVLRPGNYFGEMALIDDSPRSADAKAHEASEVFVIRKEELEDLLFVDRDLAYDLLWNFVRTLSGRLRETNDKMTFLAVTNKF
jgi:CRP/FNR family transcriptional regulator, cyclic AMP receptor protein